MSQTTRGAIEGSSGWSLRAMPALSIVGALLLMTPAEGHAQDSSDANEAVAPTTASAEAPAAEAGTDEIAEAQEANDAGLHRRPMPNYDGRPEAEADLGDALLWIPRILTGPLYLLSEYVIRQPLSYFITWIEEAEVLDFLAEMFTFGPERNVLLLPTTLYDFGFSPSVGFYLSWNDLLAENNRFSMNAATWGLDWLSLVAADHYQPREDMELSLRFEAVRRPDNLFGGIGIDAGDAPNARFGQTRFDVSGSFTLKPWRRSHIRLGAGYRNAAFSDEGWGDQPSVGQTLGLENLPSGFTHGYQALRIGASFLLDTREADQDLATGGLRISAFARQSMSFGAEGLSQDSSFGRWVHWGGSLNVGTDALGQGRVLGAYVTGEFISAFDNTLVPFTELIDVGGQGPLRGFRPGQIRGQSVVSSGVSYTWPIYVFLDAQLHWSAGNAFGPHLSNFDPEKLRMSFGIGVLPRVDGEHLFELTLAFGTETFEGGSEVNSVRFVFGARNGI